MSTSSNVLRLSIPTRRHAHLRPEPARVIPLRPNRGATEPGSLLSSVALLVAFGVALGVLALTVHSGLAFITSCILAPR